MSARVGKVLCSGPTHDDVDNLAALLKRSTRAITKKCNAHVVAERGKLGPKPSEAAANTQPDGLARARRRFVVRGYKPTHELLALYHLLRNPELGVNFQRPGWAWKLPLSLTYWMLVLLRSPTVPDLEEEDSPALFELQKEFDSNTTLAPLRDLATGKITYEVFRANVDQVTTMEEYLRTTRRCFRSILGKADLLCTTPGGDDVPAEGVPSLEGEARPGSSHQ